MNVSPILISMRTAFAALALTFAVGLLAAKGVCSIKSARARGVLDGLFTLPLVLPPTVAGFFLLYIFGVQRPGGRLLLEVFDWKVAFSWEATVLAAFVMSLPLMYRSARTALSQVDVDLLDVARISGCGEARLFLGVQIPLAWPGISTGAVLAFARALGEFGATAMIAGNIQGKTRTLPLAIYSAVAAGDMEGAMAYVWVLLTISLLTLLLMGTMNEHN